MKNNSRLRKSTATVILGTCYLMHGSSAFSIQTTNSIGRKRRQSISGSSSSSSTVLYRNSPGFVGFRDGNDNYANMRNGYSWEEPGAYYDNMRGRVAPNSSSSNLANRRSSSRLDDPYSSRSSIADDPRGSFDYSSRYSQRPHPSMMMPPHLMQQSRSGAIDGRIQGGSRQTFHNMGSGGQAFVETDGRPLNVEMELYDGPNNTPAKVKMYSEDGRQRPMNINTNYYGYGGNGGGTMSVRNVGSMEFPISAGVTSNNRGGGGYGGMMMDGYGPMGGVGGSAGMMPYDSTPIPSSARGITVQGGSLKTFKLPSYTNAAQVTIKSDGLPVNAKVELWGSSSHIKQVAEVYNDNGQTRPFAAIIDVPGEDNTIAVKNTGPMEYPIQVVVEPAGMNGGGGYGYGGDERMMMMGRGDGFSPPGLPPPPMMDGPPPFMLPPPPPF